MESTRAPGGTDMFAPMIDRGEVLGIVHVGAFENRSAFTPADLELLNSMAATSAMMLQNTRMHDETLLRDRLKYDLELAGKIQKSFLPREVISVEGLELFAEYRAAYSVGGDFYDVFWVGEDKLAVFIGDISGKGVAGCAPHGAHLERAPRRCTRARRPGHRDDGDERGDPRERSTRALLHGDLPHLRREDR